MKLLSSDIRLYQQLYKKYFDEEVNNDDARKQLTRLVRQMEIVYQPINHVQFDSYIRKYVKESEVNE